MTQVFPIPSFVIKLRDRKEQQKVFVNVCTHGFVSELEDWESLKRAAQGNVRDLEALRVPMHLTSLRQDVDKSGVACIVLDCIFHPEAIRRALHDRDIQKLLVHAAVQCLKEEHPGRFDLESDYKLPKLRYKGDRVMSVRYNPPKILEVDRKESNGVFAVGECSSGDGTEPKIETKRKHNEGENSYKISYEGTPVDVMIVQVNLSHVHPLEDVAVGVRGDQLEVRHSGGKPIQMQLPFYADTERGNAHLSLDRSLSVTLPVLPFLEYCAR